MLASITLRLTWNDKRASLSRASGGKFLKEREARKIDESAAEMIIGPTWFVADVSLKEIWHLKKDNLQKADIYENSYELLMIGCVVVCL